MARLILAIIAFVLAIAVIKMVIVALVIAGLIFRTKETVGLLAIGGAFTFIAAFPAIGLSLLAIGIVAAIVHSMKKDKAVTAIDDPPQE
jgi:predicted phage tail protein